jgi:hypothetical protein
MKCSILLAWSVACTTAICGKWHLGEFQPEKVKEMRTRLEASLKDAAPPGQESAAPKAPT